MSRNNAEKLLQEMGNIDDAYVRDYLEHTNESRRAFRMPKQAAAAVLALAVLLAGTGASSATVRIIRHYFSGIENEQRAALENYAEIAAEYGVRANQTKRYGKLEAVLNEAVAGEDELLLDVTFTLSDPAQATYGDGRITPADLPFAVYLFDQEKLILHRKSEDLYTQLLETSESEASLRLLYQFDLDREEISELVGRELTACLVYSVDADGAPVDEANAKDGGFVYSFMIPDYYRTRTWRPERSYDYEGNEIVLHSVRESALYLVLDIECAAFGHDGDRCTFLLSDDAGNIYQLYPYRDNDRNGYRFVKPSRMGETLTLQVIDNRSVYSKRGELISDEYEVLYEIPVILE